MSLYNMLHGVNLATYFFLPMLGKHPDMYPRFRDCFLNVEHSQFENKLHIYTRTGGGNREDYVTENFGMTSMPGFLGDWDDPEDNTYAFWVFDIPEKWKPDANNLLEGRLDLVSPEYREEMDRVFPKLADQFAEMFLKVTNT